MWKENPLIIFLEKKKSEFNLKFLIIFQLFRPEANDMFPIQFHQKSSMTFMTFARVHKGRKNDRKFLFKSAQFQILTKEWSVGGRYRRENGKKPVED